MAEGLGFLRGFRHRQMLAGSLVILTRTVVLSGSQSSLLANFVGSRRIPLDSASIAGCTKNSYKSSHIEPDLWQELLDAARSLKSEWDPSTAVGGRFARPPIFA